MSLLSRITNFFRGETPPTLRNKAGGMAWVKGLSGDDGEQVLNGRAVKTVRVTDSGFWLIDPPQSWVVVKDTMYPLQGFFAPAGCKVRTVQICDECLEPWREIGDDEKDESAKYLPCVPSKRDFPLGAPA